MIHGSHLRPRTRGEGAHSLEIGLKVDEASSPPDTGKPQLRQLARSDDMLRGPWAIIRYMSEGFRRGDIVCMRDADGRPRFLHNAAGVIPAGSILLTGTPGGTAIREPDLLAKAELFLRGGFSIPGARRVFVEELESDIGTSLYLQPGDRVEGWVESLGRQRWPVVADTAREPYGVMATGACDPGTMPHPVAEE
jgi:hypothetical protein